MSLVIARKKDGVVYMGADTQTTLGKGDEKRTHLCTSNTKILQLPNGIILGRVGKVHSLQYVWAHPEWFTVPEDGVMTKRHIAENIVPRIYQCFRENDLFDSDGKEDPLTTGNRFLLAHKDTLFLIDSRLGVSGIEHYAAIGAGAEYVLYGLEHPDESKDVRQQLKEMLRLGSEFCPSVSGPFVLTDTATNKIKIER